MRKLPILAFRIFTDDPIFKALKYEFFVEKCLKAETPDGYSGTVTLKHYCSKIVGILTIPTTFTKNGTYSRGSKKVFYIPTGKALFEMRQIFESSNGNSPILMSILSQRCCEAAFKIQKEMWQKFSEVQSEGN